MSGPGTHTAAWLESQRVALDFFLGGFLASRFGAFLFPMPTASHKFEDDARGKRLKAHFHPTPSAYSDKSAFWTRREEKGLASGDKNAQQTKESRLIFNPLRLPNTVTAIRSGWNSSSADCNRLSTVTAWMRSIISSILKKRS